jgi:hypothetical protein
MYDNMNIFKQISNSKEGSILLMSMLILASIVTAASSFGIVTLQNLKQAILVDNGVRSFYAAESGIEDGLYELRKNETASSALDGSGGLLNGSTWSRTVNNTVLSLTSDINENDFWHVNLYNPDSSLTQIPTPIQSLRINWIGSGSEWIEVRLTPWDTTGTLGNPITKVFSAASNPAIINVSSALYRVRVKALYSDVTDATITAFSGLDTTGSQINIPGYITMYSTGEFRKTNQVVRATMTQRAPIGEQFIYVLFSEEDLIK